MAFFNETSHNYSYNLTCYNCSSLSCSVVVCNLFGCQRRVHGSSSPPVCLLIRALSDQMLVETGDPGWSLISEIGLRAARSDRTGFITLVFSAVAHNHRDTAELATAIWGNHIILFQGVIDSILQLQVEAPLRMSRGRGVEGPVRMGEPLSTAPLKPHAQAHLLSPTDKCKVPGFDLIHNVGPTPFLSWPYFGS